MIQHEVDMTGPDAPIETKETADLIASDKVEGTPIYGVDRDKVGRVHNFMVNKRSGQVDHVIVSDGGFFGFGATQFMKVRWDRLSYEPELGGYLCDITRETMENQGRESANDADMRIW